MKLLILSDTHHALGLACDALEKERPDAVIHLGDHLTDAQELCYAYPEPEYFSVPGNCDFAPELAQTLTLRFEGVTLFAAHGHQYGVKRELLPLCAAARAAGAQLALYGHTHIAQLSEQNGLCLLNPGTAGYFGRSSYAVVEISGSSFTCRLETDTE